MNRVGGVTVLLMGLLVGCAEPPAAEEAVANRPKVPGKLRLTFRDADGVLALMDQHRQILAPKFAVVERVLTERLAEAGCAPLAVRGGSDASQGRAVRHAARSHPPR